MNFHCVEIPVLFLETTIWGPCFSLSMFAVLPVSPPPFSQNIKTLSSAAFCPNVFTHSTSVPGPHLLQSCRKGSFSSPMLCQTNTETTVEGVALFISSALRQRGHITYPTAPLGEKVAIHLWGWEQAEILQRTSTSNVYVWSGTSWGS